MSRITIITDPNDEDLEWAYEALCRENMWNEDKATFIEACSPACSLCFVALSADTKAPIGFARVVTDGIRFSSLTELVVHHHARKLGVGTALMESVLSHERVKKTTCVLGTLTAGAFYEKFSFGPVRGYMMVRGPQPIAISR